MSEKKFPNHGIDKSIKSDIINNLKPTMMNKNNYTISNVDIDKIKKYIEQANDTTSNLKDSNDINVILDKYERDLKNHSNDVEELKKKSLLEKIELVI